MQDRAEQLMSLAKKALLIPAEERTTFLQAACPQGSDLLDEVSEIVEWEERMGDFMRDPLIELIDLEGLDRPFSPGQLIADRFEIRREVGDGGMGVVYEAFDRERKERIAIKCAKLGYERLAPELNGALKVRHPNVCQVNDIHKVSSDLGEFRFITMEFLDGQTLQDRLAQGAMQSFEALEFARQLCSGLAQAHSSGVIHGDLKPANVILSPEKNSSDKNQELRAVITDFGLAVDEDGNTDLLGGTPAYMAPELQAGGRTSTASDVYALGVILYEMVTGQKPFPKADGNKNGAPAADDDIQLVQKTPIPPSKLVRQLPQKWDDAILPCLATLPEKRPSAKQVLAVFDHEPPWVLMVAIAALFFIAGIFFWQPIYNYFRSPDVTLAILPVQGPADVQSQGDSVLRAVEARLAQEPRGPRKVQLISPAAAEKKSVSTEQQAREQLHATHVLEVTLSREANGITANAAVVDLKTSAHLRDYSAHFAENDEDDLSRALASLVSASLHLPRAATPETIAPAAKAAYDKGQQYLEQDNPNPDAAIAEFQEAAKLDPHSALPPAGLAEAYILKRRALTSLAPIKDNIAAAMRLNPDSPRVLLASSSWNAIMKQKAQAVEDVTRALELEPENAKAWVRLGFANEIQGLPDRAQTAYHKAIELAPNYYKPYEYLGAFYYYSQPNYAEAEKYDIKAKELAPHRLGVYANLGALLTVQAKYPEAEKIYREALNIKETPENLNNLGVQLAFERRDREAIPYYERAIQMLPVDFYYINLADAQRRLGRGKDANENYEKALKLTTANLPMGEEDRAYMAYCLARLHKSNAELEIAEAVASANGDQQILKFGVLTYVVLGKRDKALDIAGKIPADLKKELEHHPDLADFNQQSRFTR
jgi:serine/threonine protein kinase/tetratricopeptide (TPR) repeat protein